MILESSSPMSELRYLIGQRSSPCVTSDNELLMTFFRGSLIHALKLTQPPTHVDFLTGKMMPHEHLNGDVSSLVVGHEKPSHNVGPDNLTGIEELKKYFCSKLT